MDFFPKMALRDLSEIGKGEGRVRMGRGGGEGQ